MMQWIWGWGADIFKLVLSFSLGKYPEVGLLDHMVAIF